jgi:hypothetical protein
MLDVIIVIAKFQLHVDYYIVLVMEAAINSLVCVSINDPMEISLSLEYYSIKYTESYMR